MSEPDPADRLAFVEKQIGLTRVVIDSLHEPYTDENRGQLAVQEATLRLLESERDRLRGEPPANSLPAAPPTFWIYFIGGMTALVALAFAVVLLLL